MENSLYNELVSEFGFFPLPWTFMPKSHPYSIGWRMGRGESYIGVLWVYLETLSSEEKTAYFSSQPPPPHWLLWVAEALLNVDEPDWDRSEVERLAEYQQTLDELGFSGFEHFEQALNDPELI